MDFIHKHTFFFTYIYTCVHYRGHASYLQTVFKLKNHLKLRLLKCTIQWIGMTIIYLFIYPPLSVAEVKNVCQNIIIILPVYKFCF